MKRWIVAVLLVCLGVSSLALPVQAEPKRSEIVTREEALTVASNWIALILHYKGDWGGSQIAEVREMQEFKRGERVLGYYVLVKPKGFIVVSLRKELPPVKAYSAVGELAPACDRAMADVIKGGMERTLDAIEEQLGPLASVSGQDLENILEISYRPSWEQLGKDTGSFTKGLTSGRLMDYQGGDVLLSTAWHQGAPYNSLCPTGNTACTDCCPADPGICNPTLPTLVGCVATAGAQIMNYWGWPPYGEGSPSYIWDGDNSCGGIVGGGPLSATVTDAYDWAHMANEYHWDAVQNRWEDENGDALTQAHLDAVAELSHEVGVAAEMDYGVCGSGAFHSHMEAAYENNYRYSSDSSIQFRRDYAYVDWWNLMKAQFNLNRPVQYGVPGHSLVSDGWQEVYIGGVFTRQYHMNYGWAGGNTGDPCWFGIPNSNTWYTLDLLPCSNLLGEDMIMDIYPDVALGEQVSGWYWPPLPPNPPYLYFDRDASGDEAMFFPGLFLQFAPGIKVTCTSTSGGDILFMGLSTDNTCLFTGGDPTRGIRIHDGEIRLYQNGSVKLHRK